MTSWPLGPPWLRRRVADRAGPAREEVDRQRPPRSLLVLMRGLRCMRFGSGGGGSGGGGGGGNLLPSGIAAQGPRNARSLGGQQQPAREAAREGQVTNQGEQGEQAPAPALAAEQEGHCHCAWPCRAPTHPQYALYRGARRGGRCRSKLDPKRPILRDAFSVVLNEHRGALRGAGRAFIDTYWPQRAWLKRRSSTSQVAARCRDGRGHPPPRGVHHDPHHRAAPSPQAGSRLPNRRMIMRPQPETEPNWPR